MMVVLRLCAPRLAWGVKVGGQAAKAGRGPRQDGRKGLLCFTAVQGVVHVWWGAAVAAAAFGQTFYLLFIMGEP